jgi:hypothetical protein
MVTLLNTPILTNYGTYIFEPVTEENAREIIAAGFTSFISHHATADFLSDLFGVTVNFNRTDYLQQLGEIALIFKLKSRVAEGKTLNCQEIKAIGYEFGLLRRTS